MPPTTPLIQLSDLKDALGIQESNVASDTKLTRMIQAYSAWFLQQVNRGNFMSATYTETRNGSGSREMVTRYYPVTSVQGVSIDGSVINPIVNFGDSGFQTDGLTIQLAGRAYFTKGIGNVQLQYTAGYDDVPEDVVEAIINQIVYIYKRRNTFDVNSQAAQGMVTTSFSNREFAPGVQSIINSYRGSSAVWL